MRNKPSGEPLALGDPSKLRLYEDDKPRIWELVKATGLTEQEITRRAIHIGLTNLEKQAGRKAK